MTNETATATQTQTTDASASATEASATLLASAGNETDKQTQTTETPAATATETTETTTKTTEELAAEAAKTAAEAAAKAATHAPEKYDIKAPEGTEFDPKVLEAFTAAAKEADLSQDAAQKLIEKMAPALAARQADQVKAIHDEWRAAAAIDPEFGGEKLKENLGVARKAYESFATPELRKLLDDTGMGNHPEVIRMMYRVGKAISEDTHVGGRKTASSDGAASFYPNSKMT